MKKILTILIALVLALSVYGQAEQQQPFREVVVKMVERLPQVDTVLVIDSEGFLLPAVRVVRKYEVVSSEDMSEMIGYIFSSRASYFIADEENYYVIPVINPLVVYPDKFQTY